MGFFHSRIDFDGFLESRDGLRKILARGIDDSKLEVRVRDGRVQLKRFFQQRLRLLGVAFPFQKTGGVVEIGPGICGFKLGESGHPFQIPIGFGDRAALHLG